MRQHAIGGEADRDRAVGLGIARRLRLVDDERRAAAAVRPPGVPHRAGEVQQIARVDRGSRGVVANGVEDLLVPLPGDGLRGHRTRAAVLHRHAVARAVARARQTVGGVDAATRSAIDAPVEAVDEAVERHRGALAGKRRRDRGRRASLRRDPARLRDRTRDPSGDVDAGARLEIDARADRRAAQALARAAVELLQPRRGDCGQALHDRRLTGGPRGVTRRSDDRPVEVGTEDRRGGEGLREGRIHRGGRGAAEARRDATVRGRGVFRPRTRPCHLPASVGAETRLRGLPRRQGGRPGAGDARGSVVRERDRDRRARFFERRDAALLRRRLHLTCNAIPQRYLETERHNGAARS